MAISLGVDTGGTYTDAVLVRDEETVIAAAKALTTRHDLADGIGRAVAAALRQAGVAPSEIGLASLSTTLATNALIEGQGERVGLVLIGFAEADMRRHGLAEALGDDPFCIVEGGHDHAGNPARPLDEARCAPGSQSMGMTSRASRSPRSSPRATPRMSAGRRLWSRRSRASRSAVRII
jgi:N-methylhydantoinase A/oxoprolinase/acetone carboxylase beta subunit